MAITTQSNAAPVPVAKTEELPQGIADFFRALHNEFEPRRRLLLAARERVLRLAHQGAMPDYPADSEAVSGDWKIQLPEWARDQRNQITGPADNAKILVGMCNAGDPGCMPDGEDSIVSDWAHARLSHVNTVAAIRGTLSYLDPGSGKTSRIKPSAQLMFYRPRGLHLDEPEAVPGQTISAPIVDLAAVFYETADLRRNSVKHAELRRKLCFYIPKVESAAEAAWYSDLLAAMEAAIGVPVGLTKVMFLIESLPAAYQVEEILFAARRHVIGLNLGRWDYMASLIHFKLADPNWILPDRNTIPHDITFFQNIRTRLVDCCHRRGVLAIGGMTAIFPDRANLEINARAMERLRADKKNEASIGFDGAWTGHPDQHAIAIAQFPSPNQLSVTHSEAPRRPDLTPSPAGIGAVTVAGTKDAIRTVIEYRYGVLCGLGARMIKGYDRQGNLIGNFMEDLATDRIYRLMIAQRIRHGVVTEEGVRITPGLVSQWFEEELQKILHEHAKQPEYQAVAEKYTRASAWSQEMIKEITEPKVEARVDGFRTWTYPAAEFAKMYAPLERIAPADKLRALLRQKFAVRRTNPAKSYLHTAGAYDAVTASLLTELGFEAIYASGWQLAVAHNMYPDIGIYPSHSMVELVRELNRGVEGARDRHFYDSGGEVLNVPPIFADIEAGFGGPTQTFTLARELIRAGVAGVHLEDQDPAERTCGHIVSHHGSKRSKVLVPAHKWMEKLIAVKAAAQATHSTLVIIARTDAVDGQVPSTGQGGLDHAIERALEAASLGVDVIWPEFNNTDLDEPRRFAEGVHKYFPDQMLGFNLSPSLHWGKAKKEGKLLTNEQLGQMGYVLQFSTLLAFRTVGMALEASLKSFRHKGLEALADLQLAEIEHPNGEPRTRMHQRFAGTNRWLTLEKLSRGA
ncbi:MAG: isocitrate lyase/phosphoenolpyruvate mutase family protein [Elusimicrobia bacterium]|nr:isocitrate lyase/phosphoenolpyruvate mutase family protein [Elusimicrobiota bacterium]